MITARLEPFAEPAAGAALLAVLALGWLLAARSRARARALVAVAGRRAAVLAAERSPARIRLRAWLGLAGLALGVLAWMQPRLLPERSAAATAGTDLCLCLDVSRSMLARDLRPSRLGFARQAIAELAQRTRGDRLALVLFAGEARLRVPLTRDVASLTALAQTADPIDVPLGGTDLAAAVDAGVEALAAARGGRDDGAPLEGAVVLITDGEDPSGAGRAAAERARARGLRVHCVGLGSALGSKITVTGPDGRETFLLDRAGREVVSRMEPASLRAIAAAGEGLFVDGGSRAAPLVAVYERAVVPERTPAAEAAAGAGRPGGYRIPLGAGILLLLAELLVGERRRAAGGAR